MKNRLLFIMIWPKLIFGQNSQSLDSIFYIDGNIDGVKILELSESNIKFQYPGESFIFNYDIKKIKKIITSTGREIILKSNLSNKNTLTKNDSLDLNNVIRKPGIYYDGLNCSIIDEISASDVKIKCFNEKTQSYHNYTVKKSKLDFYKTFHEWKIFNASSIQDNIIHENHAPGLYYKGVLCEIIKGMPDGFVKIKYLNETGRAYYREIVLGSELIEIK